MSYDLVLYRKQHALFFFLLLIHQLSTPFLSMARPKKSKPAESSDAGSGEAFSDVNDSDLSGSESESSAGDYEIQIPQGNWEVPILGAKAQRTEYEQVSNKFLCTSFIHPNVLYLFVIFRHSRMLSSR
jgi:hypothetical protein